MFAFVCLFTLYRGPVDSAVKDVLNNIGIEDSVISSSVNDANVAYAAGQQGSTLQSRVPSLQSGVTSYNISLATSVGVLGRKWVTDTDHTNTDALYSATEWHFGNTDMHSTSGCSSVWLDIDLGQQVGLLAAAGKATLSFSGTFSKGSNLDNGTFNIFSSSSDFGRGVPGDIHGESRDGSGPNAMFSGENTGDRTYSATKALGGRYVRIILSSYDAGGPFYKWGPVYMRNMSLKLNITDTTSPTITPTASSVNSNKISISDDTGIRSYSIKYTKPQSSETITAATGGSTSSNVKSYSYTMTSFGYYTVTATDQANRTTTRSFYYYSASVSAASSNGTYGTASTNGGSGMLYNAAYTLTAKLNSANNGYYFAGWQGGNGVSGQNLGIGSYNSSNGSWNINTNVQYLANGTQSWTAMFKSIGELVSVPTDPVYDRTPKGVSVAAVKDVLGNSLTVTVTYTGTTYGGTVYNSTSAPTYAGDYTATVAVSYNGSPLGSGSFGYSVGKVSLEIMPYVYSAEKVYDSTNTVLPDGWNIYTDSNRLAQFSDESGLSITGTSSVLITLSDQNCGAKNIDSLTNIGNVKLSHSNSDVLNSYSATVVTGRAKCGNSVITTYTINKRPVNIVGMVIREKTAANASEVYTGKVYDRTNALGANVVAYVYSSSDGAAEFNATDYGAGTVGIGIKLSNLIAGENLSASFSAAAETIYFSLPTFQNANAGSKPNITLNNVNVNSVNYSKGSVSATATGLTIAKKQVSVSFSLSGSLTYDGSADVTGDLSPSIDGIIAGDNVAVSGYTGTLNDKNAGDGRILYRIPRLRFPT